MLTYARIYSVFLALTLSACGSDSDAAADAAAGTADAAPGAADAAAEDLDMQASDFECILNGTKVRKFFVVNKLGHLDDALAVANSATGGTYPVGTILQLIPFEAMVKRRAGWNPTTNDWEFFSLNTSAAGTTIASRGVEGVENQFGGNCFECHSKAAPQWDLICESTHGCDPLQINDTIIGNLQSGDQRCP